MSQLDFARRKRSPAGDFPSPENMGSAAVASCTCFLYTKRTIVNTTYTYAHSESLFPLNVNDQILHPSRHRFNGQPDALQVLEIIALL